MPDVRESDLPKITNYSDIKELRLVKTDGSSVSMTVDNFINAVAEKIARVDGFASVVAELTLKGQSLESYIYPSNVDDITRFAVALVDERWKDNPLSNYGKYGLLFSIGVPFEGKLDLMCIHILIASVTGTSQVLIRTMWNKSWQGWKSI